MKGNKMMKIGCIGTGNMGGALARAIGKSGHELYLSDHFTDKALALAAELGKNAHASDNAKIAAECDMILLGVKPQMLDALATEIAPLLAARKTHVCLVSMAAGITLARLAELFGELDLDGTGYIIADETTKTAIPGVFAAGDVRTKALRQVVTAASDGAVAAHFAEEYLTIGK